jgi:hypothetical protein
MGRCRGACGGFAGGWPAPVKRWWKRVRGRPVIGMYPIARQEVEQIIRCQRGRLVEVIENTASGRGWKSLRYCAVNEP